MQPTFTLTQRSIVTLSVFLFAISTFVSGQERPIAPVVPHGISPSWYGQAVAAIEDREYSINALDQRNVYGAVNHAQHLGYWFTADGYGVKNFNEDGSAKDCWQAEFLLSSVGRKGRPAGTAFLTAARDGQHSLQFNYGGYSIRYDNEKTGMEQSFLVQKKPHGPGPLEIMLQLRTDLEAAVGGDDRLLLSTAGHPRDVKLEYDRLKVWDRNQRLLPAHLSLSGSHRLVLTVDDSKAAYPVTVDPFTHSPQTFLVNNILNSGVLDVTAQTLYGFSVSGAGDVNGDGVNDIIIGAPTFAAISSIAIVGAVPTLSVNTGVAATGAAFIYYGIPSSVPSTTPSVVLHPGGLAAGALFGFTVGTAGNAGGSATHQGVVVGAPGDQIQLTILASPTTVAVGRAYVYTSSSNFTTDVTAATTPDAILALRASDFSAGGPTRNPLYGFSVADAGDVNGDGFDDIIVGSPMYNDGTAAGRIDIYKGSATGVVTTPVTTITGGLAGENFGFSVSGAGKVNNDNIADVVIGAPGSIFSGGVIQGHAYIFHGALTTGITATVDNQATGTVGTVLTGPGAVLGTLFGFSVSTAGDVDNDTHDDVIVGAPLSLNGSGLNVGANGKAYVFYGGSTASGAGSPSLPMATLTSPRSAAGANLLFGFSVGKAGNVTGDASGDVLVGEPGSIAISNPLVTPLLSSLGLTSPATNTSGQAYVFAGNSGPGISTFAIFTINDPSTPNLLGASVHYAGDVDGDGHADFLVGEPSGILDLGFNLTALQPIPGAGLSGTLVVGSNKGLIASGNIGKSILTFGFSGTLPITMLSFTGQPEKGDVLLSWVTAQEENSDYFQVERSTDGVNFSAIGRVTAAHNSSSPTNYSFTDLSPAGGSNYYRLNMVDLDGQSSYSKIVVVSFNSVAGSEIGVYPNPAHGSFRLLFRNMAIGRYEMSLLNTAGQRLQGRIIQVSDPANYNETIALEPGIAQGTYLVKIVDQQQRTYVTRVVVQ